MPPIETQRLVARAVIMLVLITVNVWMFSYLIKGLSSGDLEPAISAILSSLATAVTGAIGLAAKDFFNPQG